MAKVLFILENVDIHISVVIKQLGSWPGILGALSRQWKLQPSWIEMSRTGTNVSVWWVSKARLWDTCVVDIIHLSHIIRSKNTALSVFQWLNMTSILACHFTWMWGASPSYVPADASDKGFLPQSWASLGFWVGCRAFTEVQSCLELSGSLSNLNG